MAESQDSTVAVDEAELSRLAREGDRTAFNELVDRYAGKVFRLARHITKNDHDAEDVLQETFLKAYSRLDQFQGNSSFYTWLVRIAVNEALMRLRRNKSAKTLSIDEELQTEDSSIARELPSQADDPEETFSREELREAVSTAIDSLPETYRAVLVLRDIEGFSTEETAQMLDLSISAVKSRLLRARLQLREKLQRRWGNRNRHAEDHV